MKQSEIVQGIFRNMRKKSRTKGVAENSQSKEIVETSQSKEVAEISQPKELTYTEARNMLDDAVQELKSHGVIDPTIDTPYPLVSWSTQDHKFVARMTSGFTIFITSIVSVGLASANSSLWICSALSGLLVGTILHTIFSSKLYNGITNNSFERAVIKLFFNKEAKMKLEDYRQKFEEYKKLEEPYRLVVELTRAQLEKDQVFKTLHEGGYYAILNDEGEKVMLSDEEYKRRNPTIAEKKLSERHNKLMKQIEAKMSHMT